MRTVTCKQCTKFIPSVFNPSQGIGTCRALTEYAKKLGRKIRNSEFNQAYRALGFKSDGRNYLFYPDIERECSKFESIDS